MNLPNSLTLGRVSLAPVLALVMLPEVDELSAAMIFAVGMTSDVVDGYLARSGGLITRFGELMDPIADKLFVGTALVCLAATNRIAVWIVAVVFARDLLVTGLRFMARRRGTPIAANRLGKAKTVIQAVTVFVLLAVSTQTLAVQLLVFLMVTVTVISGAVYSASYLRGRHVKAAATIAGHPSQPAAAASPVLVGAGSGRRIMRNERNSPRIVASRGTANATWSASGLASSLIRRISS